MLKLQFVFLDETKLKENVLFQINESILAKYKSYHVVINVQCLQTIDYF